VFELLLGLGEQRRGGRERTLRVGADGRRVRKPADLLCCLLPNFTNTSNIELTTRQVLEDANRMALLFSSAIISTLRLILSMLEGRTFYLLSVYDSDDIAGTTESSETQTSRDEERHLGLFYAHGKPGRIAQVLSGEAIAFQSHDCYYRSYAVSPGMQSIFRPPG
jgi:hypothetical protein